MMRLGIVAAIAAVGFGLGRWLRADEVQVAAPLVDAAAPVASWASLELKGDPCDHVAFVEALLARTRDEIEGVAQPFPADDPTVHPAAFHERLEAAKRACPEMTVDHVDCDEYPCIAWVRDPCPGAGDELRSVTSSIRNVTLSGGRSTNWGTLALRSEGDEGSYDRQSNGARRMETRERQASRAIQQATGARPMTEAEENLERARQAEADR